MYELIKDYSKNIVMKMEMDTMIGTYDDTGNHKINYKPGIELVTENDNIYYRFRRSNYSRIEFNSVIFQPSRDFSLHTKFRLPYRNNSNFTRMICDSTHTWIDRGFGLCIPRYSNTLTFRCNDVYKNTINLDINKWYEILMVYDNTNKTLDGYIDNLLKPIFSTKCNYTIDSQWMFTIGDISSWYDNVYGIDMDMDFIRLYNSKIEFTDGFSVCKSNNNLYNPFKDIPLLKDKDIKLNGFPKTYLSKLNSGILSSIPKKFRILTQNTESAN